VRRVGRKNKFVSVSGDEASKLERRDGRNAKDLPDANSGASDGRSLARRGARSPIGLDEPPCLLVAHLRSHVYFRLCRLKHDVRLFRDRWLLSFYQRNKAGFFPRNACSNGPNKRALSWFLIILLRLYGVQSRSEKGCGRSRTILTSSLAPA
jgi:hypothetical protein